MHVDCAKQFAANAQETRNLYLYSTPFVSLGSYSFLFPLQSLTTRACFGLRDNVRMNAVQKYNKNLKISVFLKTRKIAG